MRSFSIIRSIGLTGGPVPRPMNLEKSVFQSGMDEFHDSVIIMRKDPDMPTHEFVAVLKRRRDELSGELESINRIINFHEDIGEIVRPSNKGKDPVGRKKGTPGKSPRSLRIDPVDREKMIGMLKDGKSAGEMFDAFRGKYRMMTIKNLRYNLTKK